ncbi:MAG: hypothetical protein NC305_04015 [Lachnospiraceae bacterium]|nr:hypothetical protein [Muribaculaceae bacterium]MCM1409697.1 hypothetical protein [Lachnospiraceae bacterium]
MIQFFQSVAGFIETVVSFVISFFRNLFLLITMVPKTLAAITAVLNLFPPFIIVPVTALVFLSLVIAILNKWG